MSTWKISVIFSVVFPAMVMLISTFVLYEVQLISYNRNDDFSVTLMRKFRNKIIIIIILQISE